MIKIYQKKINDSSINEISEFRAGSWIRAYDVSEQEMHELEKIFKVNSNILRDALDPYEVPRLETDSGIVYIFTRTPQKLEEKIITLPLLIIIGPDFVMTVSKSKNIILDKFLNNELEFTTTQKTQLVLKFLSEIIKNYNGFLTGISRSVRETSDKFTRVNDKIIISFVGMEEVLNDFLLGLTHTNPALQNIISGKLIKLYDQDKELMEDLVLNSNQLIELCKSTLKNIVNVREAYSTVATNELNRVIKLFTSLTVILTIPTIIASLYGMNVALPLSQHHNAFWLVVLGTGGIVSIISFIFIRNRWL